MRRMSLPPLRLIGAAVEPLEGLSGWGGLRKSKQRRQSNQRKEAPWETADYYLCFATLKSVTLFWWQRIASTFRPFQGETEKSQYASTNKINSSEASRQLFHEIHIHNFTELCAVHIGESAPNRYSYAAVIPARFRIRLANIVSSSSICHVRR